MINNEKLTHLDLARLVLIYTLRYERNTSNDSKGLRNELAQKRNVNDTYLRVMCSSFALHICFNYLVAYVARTLLLRSLLRAARLRYTLL